MPPSRRVGSSSPRTTSPLETVVRDGLITLDAPGHVLTIAPSPSPADFEPFMPTLREYAGTVIVVDPGGRRYHAAAQARRDLGQQVIKLDPFYVLEQQTDGLNPLEFPDQDATSVEMNCYALARSLFGAYQPANAIEDMAFRLLCGILGYLQCVPEKRSMSALVDVLKGDDIVYNLAVVLDTIGKRIPIMSYREIASFLQLEDAQRSPVLLTLSTRVKAAAGYDSWKRLEASPANLAQALAAGPTTVFAVLPPEQNSLHFSILGLLIDTVLKHVTHPPNANKFPAMLLLDEAFRFSDWVTLDARLLYGKPSAVVVWSLWRYLRELWTAFPVDWQILIQSHAATQVFGVRDYLASGEVAATLGVEAEDIRSLPANELIVGIDGANRIIRYVTA